MHSAEWRPTRCSIGNSQALHMWRDSTGTAASAAAGLRAARLTAVMIAAQELSLPS